MSVASLLRSPITSDAARGARDGWVELRDGKTPAEPTKGYWSMRSTTSLVDGTEWARNR
jgi:hypothetical protein